VTRCNLRAVQSFRENHRDQPDLLVDVAVLGAGAAGSSAAWHLALRGPHALLLDRGCSVAEQDRPLILSPEAWDVPCEMSAPRVLSGASEISGIHRYNGSREPRLFPFPGDGASGRRTGRSVSRSDVREALCARAEEQGVTIWFDTAVTGVDRPRAGILNLKLRRQGHPLSVACRVTLYARWARSREALWTWNVPRRAGPGPAAHSRGDELVDTAADGSSDRGTVKTGRTGTA
jgi:2-polyprenyl-6-methoxyphenol hydroxylase-like FAD-dependent oxidoreductase